MKTSELISNRVLVELFAPPFLAVVWFVVMSSDTVLYKCLGFLPFLFFAYMVCAIPSLIYTFAMEAWFRMGGRTRLGYVGSACFSSLLGAGAGCAVAAISGSLRLWIPPEYNYLTVVGAVVGLLVGCYVSKKQKSAA